MQGRFSKSLTILSFIAFFATPALLAQRSERFPLEAVFHRETVREKLVPVVVNENGSEITNQMQKAIDELANPFDREQIVDYSLTEIISDEIADLEKKITKLTKNQQDWLNFLRRIRNMSIRAKFNLRISPNPETLSLKFKNPEMAQALASAEGTLLASPSIELLGMVGATLVEIDPQTGDEKKYPIPVEALSEVLKIAKFQMPQTRFQISAVTIDHFGPQSPENPTPPLTLEIQNWQSTFKDVVFPDSQVKPVVEKLISEEVGFRTVETLMQTDAFRLTFGDVKEDALRQNLLNLQTAFNKDVKVIVPYIEKLMAIKMKAPELELPAEMTDERRSVLDREIKKQLEDADEEIILWIERGVDGSIKPHLSSPHSGKAEAKRLLAMADRRLLFESHASISLAPKDFKVRYDANSRLAEVTFVPKDLFTAKFELDHAILPQDWMPKVDDPVVAAVLSQLFDRDFAKTNPGMSFQPTFSIEGGEAKVFLPVEWNDGAPQVNLAEISANIEFLNNTFLDRADIAWPSGEAVSFDFRASRSVPDQFLDQAVELAKAHQSILGPKFFQNIQTEVLKVVEKEVLKFEDYQLGSDPKVKQNHVRVTSFPISSEGAVSCTYGKVDKALSMNETFRAYVLWPAGSRIPMGILEQPGLVDLECEVTLPRKIDIQVDNVKKDKADIDQIKFSLESTEKDPPKMRTRWRLIRDKESGIFLALPLEVDTDKALQDYKITNTAIGNVDPKGWGEAKESAALTLGWFMRRAQDVTGLKNGGDLLPTVVQTLKNEEVLTDLKKEIESAKIKIRRDLIQQSFLAINGDVAARRQLALQSPKQRILQNEFPIQILPPNWVDPQKVDHGLIGAGQNWFADRLNFALSQAQLQLRQPVGQLVIPNQGKLVEIVNCEVVEAAQQTVCEDPEGVTKISEQISNPIAQQKTMALKNKVSEWLSKSVSRNYKQIEVAAVDFIRAGTPSEASKLEQLQTTLSSRLQEVLRRRTSVKTDLLKLPDFCGFSVVAGKNQQGDQIYSVLAGVDPNKNLPGTDFRAASRGPYSVDINSILYGVDPQGEIPVTITTDFLEEIANDPANLARVEQGIRDQALASGKVNETFEIHFTRVRVRIDANGRAVVRMQIKMHQHEKTAQNVTSNVLGFIPDAIVSLFAKEDVTVFRDIFGAPGWILDKAGSPITNIDGYVTIETPVDIDMRDIITNGKNEGLKMTFNVDPQGVLVKREKGWGTLFGHFAKKDLVAQVKEMKREVVLPPLSIPDYEEHLDFLLGDKPIYHTMHVNHGIRGAYDPGESEARGLYKGILQFNARLNIKPESANFPEYTVYRKPATP